VYARGEALRFGDVGQQFAQRFPLGRAEPLAQVVFVGARDPADVTISASPSVVRCRPYARRSSGLRRRSTTPRRSSESTSVTNRLGGTPRWAA
jgi:hypothetical protein